MSRRILFWIVGVVVFVTLAAYLFFENMEPEIVQKKSGMSLEARRNRYLATERFLARMGRQTQRIERPVALESLPEGGVLILATAGNNDVMNADRAQKILDWVARGGYLILEWDWIGTENPLVAPFGVKEGDREEEKKGIVRRERDVSSGTSFFVEASLPGSGQRYRLSPGHTMDSMEAGETPPLWQVENRYGNDMLHYAWGRGNVTLIGSLGLLNNHELGDFDHAEFFWALLRRYQPEGVIHFAQRLEYQTLWQWLSTTAWRALLGTAALILLWLFWVVPRFGCVRAVPEVERRGLSEHLLALGRCLWREKALASLLDTARREIDQRLAQRHPRLLRLPVPEQHQELARQSGLAVAEINAALGSVTPPSPETFTRAMQTVQDLERAL
ncbi:MAG: DUF4350 domain-containing protein [Zoogloeaceae bacterium]|jgi:hypothetical protein|nr:DUF4350 domain-containing protein [Zoogloeaceae bacterium]